MDWPFTFELALPRMRPTCFDNHIVRKLSALEGQFADHDAYASWLTQRGDSDVYEVYEIRRPELAGELMHGVSIVHPGKIGHEYYMTKGHFHLVLGTAEIYYCLRGQGRMVMETPEGDWSIAELRQGRVLYIPPRWAHRSVNTGNSDLITLFVYPADAGHDYGTLETRGFRKLIVERDGLPAVIDNPHWLGG